MALCDYFCYLFLYTFLVKMFIPWLFTHTNDKCVTAVCGIRVISGEIYFMLQFWGLILAEAAQNSISHGIVYIKF